MKIGDFCELVAEIGKRYRGSITSWGRTVARSVAVGGFAGDPHTAWLGADMVYDSGANRPGSHDHVKTPRSCPECNTDKLKVIHESSHDHYQPRDWINQ